MTQRPTPERIEEIRKRGYGTSHGCTCEKDVPELLAEIDALEQEVKGFRTALENIAEEPNRMGLISDQVIEEYNIKAWQIAHEALK